MENKANSIDLTSIQIENKAVFVIDRNIAIKYSVLPFKIENNKIHVAMANISDVSAKDYLRFSSKKEIIPYIVSKEQINQYIELCYGSETIKEAVSNYSNPNSHDEVKDKTVLNQITDDAPAIKIVASILNNAIIKNASDVHIEPFRNKVDIRIRIDGILHKLNNVDYSMYDVVCTRIKIMAFMDITERKMPQDGSLSYEYESEIYNMRVSTIPVIHGEKIVIRIIYDSMKLIDINALSDNKDSCSQIKRILNYESGLVLLTGPTGSGKTTTLYTLLNKLTNCDKNIITIENPVEYEMYGVNQVNLNSNKGLTFEKCLKNILRQDPDVIGIGEIRDEETAAIAVRAAISGHLVFSTLHTRSCSEAILRLLNMKVPWYILHDCICTIISQRLIKRICPYCKEEYKISSYENNILNETDEYIATTAFRGKGCIKCKETGYLGRTAIFETLHFNSNNRNLIDKEYISQKLSGYMEENKIKNLMQICLKMVADGKTSISEFIKIKSAM